MEIIPLTHDLSPLLLTQDPGARSTGLHMSDIYNDMYQDLEPARFQRGSELPALRVAAGLACEQMLEEGMRRLIGGVLKGERPGELSYRLPSGQVLAYSPDLLFQEGDDMVLGEIKLTWMSSRDVPQITAARFPPKFDKYFTQMKLYCHCLGITKARLFVFFVNGDYKPPTPKLLGWDVIFSPRDIAEAWSAAMNHGTTKGLVTP
jgi:hypothetical protein